MSEDLSDSYLRNVARSVGVQPLWIEDCVQEMRIKLWQVGPDYKYPRSVARYTGIDFQRKVANFNRRTKMHAPVSTFTALAENSRHDGLSEVDALTSPEPPTDAVMDARAAIARLEPRDQRLIARLARGETMKQIGVNEGISEGRVSQLVIRARERLCA